MLKEYDVGPTNLQVQVRNTGASQKHKKLISSITVKNGGGASNLTSRNEGPDQVAKKGSNL